MAEKKTRWYDTRWSMNPWRPKEGDFSKGRTHWWDGKKWVKNNVRADVKPEDSDKYFGVGNYGSGGSKESERSKLQGNKNNKNNTNNKSKTTPKKGPVVKSVGTVDFNINTPAGLTSYNKALKASKGLKTDKERDKSTNKVLKEERDSNRNKISANNKGSKKGNNFTTNVHTRHYKTGERLGVMTRNQRRAYEKEAGGKTFKSEVAKHEKSSGHGKPHLRETKYKASLRKGKTTNGSNNRKNLTIKEQHQIKLNEQQQTTAKQMQGDPRYKGPKFKKKKR